MILLLGKEKYYELFKDYIFCGLLFYTDEIISNAQLCGLVSLRYAIVDKPIDNDNWSFCDFGQSEEFIVYENKHALPRAYLATGYVETQNEAESLEEIDHHLQGLLTGRLVVLENGTPSFASKGQSAAAGSASISSISMNGIMVNVRANAPALLVVTDSYYPGWHAYVDGIKTPIWRANSIFKTVEVGPGDHMVVFKYQPHSFYFGVLISLITAMLVLSGLIIERRNRKAFESRIPLESGGLQTEEKDQSVALSDVG